MDYKPYTEQEWVPERQEHNTQNIINHQERISFIEGIGGIEFNAFRGTNYNENGFYAFDASGNPVIGLKTALNTLLPITFTTDNGKSKITGIDFIEGFLNTDELNTYLEDNKYVKEPALNSFVHKNAGYESNAYINRITLEENKILSLGLEDTENIAITKLSFTKTGLELDSPDPTDDKHIVKKKYVDEKVKGYDNTNFVLGGIKYDDENELTVYNASDERVFRVKETGIISYGLFQTTSKFQMIADNPITEDLDLPNKKYVDNTLPKGSQFSVYSATPATLPTNIPTGTSWVLSATVPVSAGGNVKIYTLT